MDEQLQKQIKITNKLLQRNANLEYTNITLEIENEDLRAKVASLEVQVNANKDNENKEETK